MESESSAKHILSLFSSSNLAGPYDPSSSRTFYDASPTVPVNSTPEHAQQPPRKRRRLTQAGEWKCAEIRALETYRNLVVQGDDIDESLRDVLLPNRTNEEVKLGLVQLEKTIRERRGRKLRELEKQEEEMYEEEEKARAVEREKDNQRRRQELDDILGLATYSGDQGDGDRFFRNETNTRQTENAKDSLDRVLGLTQTEGSGETYEQRRKRELDEALGLSWS
jgi:hypothetical protein